MLEGTKHIVILLFMAGVILFKIYWETITMQKISQIENSSIMEEEKKEMIKHIKKKFKRRLKYFALAIGIIFFVLLSIMSK